MTFSNGVYEFSIESENGKPKSETRVQPSRQPGSVATQWQPESENGNLPATWRENGKPNGNPGANGNLRVKRQPTGNLRV
jgi:hypothetical protein